MALAEGERMTHLTLVLPSLFAILGVASISEGLACLSWERRRRRLGITWLIGGTALLFAAGFLVAGAVYFGTGENT